MRQFLLYLFHPFVTVLLGMVCCSCGSAAEDDLIPADNRYLRLSLSPATELDAGATQIALKVETNLDYSVVVDAEWLKLQETTLPKDGSLHFSVEANPTSDTRTATIVVADRNDRYYSQSVKVVQRGNPNPVEELSIVDKQATAQTKDSYSVITTTYGMDATGTTNRAAQTQKPCAETILECSA